MTEQIKKELDALPVTLFSITFDFRKFSIAYLANNRT